MCHVDYGFGSTVTAACVDGTKAVRLGSAFMPTENGWVKQNKIFLTMAWNWRLDVSSPMLQRTLIVHR